MNIKQMRFRYLVLMGCFFCAYFSTPALAKDTLRLGFSNSLTGVYSQAATSQMNAYQVWKDKVNEQGGIYVKSLGKKLPVEFVYYDDRSSPATAVKVYEKLITQVSRRER